MVRLVQHTADDDPKGTRVRALSAAMQNKTVKINFPKFFIFSTSWIYW